MPRCSFCGADAESASKFCPDCGRPIEENGSNVTYTETRPVYAAQQPTYNAPPEKKINIATSTYIGHKWFLKIPYKTYETDVRFSDKSVCFYQDVGSFGAAHKIPTDIEYKRISYVESKVEFSIPNIVFSVIVALAALVTQIWAALIIIPVVLFIGRTAVTKVIYSGGVYLVPTEFKSEADELKSKIDSAMSQAGR